MNTIAEYSITEIIADLYTIYNHFGKENQINKLAEECVEYLENYITNRKESYDPEEVADVLVVALQLAFNDPEVAQAVKDKIARTITRIGEGYYRNEEENGYDSDGNPVVYGVGGGKV